MCVCVCLTGTVYHGVYSVVQCVYCGLQYCIEIFGIKTLYFRRLFNHTFYTIKFPFAVYIKYIIHNIYISGFIWGGGGHLSPLESYVPPLEFALHTPTLHGTPLKILNRPLFPTLQKLLDETLHIIASEESL